VFSPDSKDEIGEGRGRRRGRRKIGRKMEEKGDDDDDDTSGSFVEWMGEGKNAANKKGKSK
jgi:hypothetical protein